MSTPSNSPYKLLLNLGSERQTKLSRIVAQSMLADPSTKVNMTTIILEALDAHLAEMGELPDAGKAGKPIVFKPSPEVRDFINRARLNSGMTTDQVLNQMILAAVAEGAGA
jgi:hypothetical protein